VSTVERIPITMGESGATVERVRGADGRQWIEKTGTPGELVAEAAVLRWLRGKLPVAEILAEEPGRLAVTLLPGRMLCEGTATEAVAGMREALQLLATVPAEGCPVEASWSYRCEQAEARVRAGLVDEEDFDEVRLGRTAAEILRELVSFPAPPRKECRFTHGDLCLPNVLTMKGRIMGMVDWGRAGITHPAQDWALALRSLRHNFGAEAEQELRRHLPPECRSEALLEQFLLLDELF
jgi:aminoglycoside phosphotransferase